MGADPVPGQGLTGEEEEELVGVGDTEAVVEQVQPETVAEGLDGDGEEIGWMGPACTPTNIGSTGVSHQWL